VRGLDAEVVQEAEAVGGHVVQGVRRAGGQAGEGTDQGATADAAPQPRGPPGVTVVEAHHVEAVLGQLPAQLLVPPRERAAEAHDEQQRLAVGTAEGLVAQLHTRADGRAEEVGHRKGHAASRP